MLYNTGLPDLVAAAQKHKDLQRTRVSMSRTSSLPFAGIGTDALGHLGHARNAGSYRCKFSAIYDWLDNHTSPHVGAKIVAIDLTSRRSSVGGTKKVGTPVQFITMLLLCLGY